MGMLVFVQAPSRQVHLVNALVADVTAAVIPVPVPVIVEAVAIEWVLRGGAKKEVIVDFAEVIAGVTGHLATTNGERVLLAFGHRPVGIPSYVVTRLVAQALNHVYFAEFALVQKLHSLPDVFAGAALEADFNNAVVPACGLDHLSAFPDVMGAGFFHVDMLSGLAGPYREKGMPMIRGGGGDGVDVLVLEDAAEIVFGRGRRALDLLDFLDPVGKEVFVNVT